jgi:outer membrane protein OmpA-like peptidoglycan-associated protein
MRLIGCRLAWTIGALLCVAAQAVAQPAAEDAAQRIDYLTFAQGAVPLSISGAGSALGANFEHAVKIIDGSPQGFTIVNKGTRDTATEFVYELPAATVFERFAVPQVLETPSPSATFTRRVEVFGSSKGPGDGYELLADATLATHKDKGDVTVLAIAKKTAVRWVKVKLSGGIELPRGEGALEFSELIGNGTQETASFSDRFDGMWRAGANIMDLKQQGAIVSGCFDRTGDLRGTVTGSVLRATGVDRSDKTKSAFILSVAPDGQMRGVRSTNGGPFRLYVAPVAVSGTKSSCEVPKVAIGCGSIVHGINFDLDSAVLRSDAEPVLAALFDGLKNDKSGSIGIEGHTSSEGATAYNQALSERRAKAVVADLTTRGIAASRLSAVGVGEARPIANNSDENGRAMNRRVEVLCR